VADLRRDLERLLNTEGGFDELIGAPVTRLLVGAILHWITAPESEGGLGWKIMPRMLTGKMRARYEQAMMEHYRQVGSEDAAALAVNPNDVAYFAYWDAAPPYPGAPEDRIFTRAGFIQELRDDEPTTPDQQ